jgi:hypothetical protein
VQTSDDFQLEIFRITINNIYDVIIEVDEWKHPQKTVQDWTDGLLPIRNLLLKLRKTSCHDLRQLIDKIDAARIHLGCALDCFGKDENINERSNRIRACRERLYEAQEVIEGYLGPSP